MVMMTTPSAFLTPSRFCKTSSLSSFTQSHKVKSLSWCSQQNDRYVSPSSSQRRVLNGSILKHAITSSFTPQDDNGNEKRSSTNRDNDEANGQTFLTTAFVDVLKLSPMMKHYVHTRRRLAVSLCSESDRELILLYRVGDFFESFFEDAHALSTHCGLALTSKDGGKLLGSRVPMAGLPHFCLDDKVSILLARNVTVAVVDQISNTSPDGNKNGLMQRAITRLLAPATATLDATRTAYVAAVVLLPSRARATTIFDDGDEFSTVVDDGGEDECMFGFSYADACGGEFRATQDISLSAFRTLLATLRPAELVVSPGVRTPQATRLVDEIIRNTKRTGSTIVTSRAFTTVEEAERIVSNFHSLDNVESLGCRGQPLAVCAAASVVTHLSRTLSISENDQAEEGISLNALTTFTQRDYLQLDEAALRNLEVLESARDASRQRSLQWAVDRTVTCMGARRLRSWLVHPRTDIDIIDARLDAVEALYRDGCVRDSIQNRLQSVPDLERVAGRVNSRRVTPRELRWLCESICSLPALLEILPQPILAHRLDDDCPKPGVQFDDNIGHIKSIDINDVYNTDHNRNNATTLTSLSQYIVDVLADPAPSTLPSPDSVSDTGTRVLRPGWNARLDELRAGQQHHQNGTDSQQSWITELEQRERERSGVDSLCVKHVRNYGYVVRVPRSLGERMLGRDELTFSKLGYERVQGTKVELRFTFSELRKRAREHALAVAEIIALERRLFFQLCDALRPHVLQIRALGALIASIDVVASFAAVASERGYVRPSVFVHDKDTTAIVDIENGRHPVVEQLLPMTKSFVANSLQLGRNSDYMPELLLLCGPNAAGKSCALRSIGLCVILAHAGCFVPATRATFSICDRIFTRVGAVDDVAKGQSTFQVEMAETACILSHATYKSVVLLDEIGRGTSTADGIAIAWSVAEELSQRPHHTAPLTMFVTHFHELNYLAQLYDNVFAMHVAMKEGSNGEMISTHVIHPGPSYLSLGIATAERAGFPTHVLQRAKYISEIVSNPCKAVGQQLQTALSEEDSDGGDIDFEGAVHVAEILKESDVSSSRGDNDKIEEYEKGFADGYRKALESVGNIVDKMRQGVGADGRNKK